jgi:hypothetical protein
MEQQGAAEVCVAHLRLPPNNPCGRNTNTAATNSVAMILPASAKEDGDHAFADADDEPRQRAAQTAEAADDDDDERQRRGIEVR